MVSLKKSFVTAISLFIMLTVGLRAEPLRVPKGPSGTVEGMVVPPPISLKQQKYFEAHPAEFQSLLARLPKIKTTRQESRPQSASEPPAANLRGTWQPTLNAPPASGLGNPLLMTDGSVIVHQFCTPNWYKLTPNFLGSYINGRWSQIKPMQDNYTPLYFASQVLNDGKVIVNGGEYGGNDSSCSQDRGTGGAIYDPVRDTWTTVAPPSNWGNIGDAQSIIRFDGTYMLANCCSTQQAYYSESTGTWTDVNVAGKFDANDEEGWVFLPDGRIATVDAYVFTSACGNMTHTNQTEAFAADGSGWSALPDATEQLADCSGNSSGRGPSHEVGPVVLRADRTVVAFSGVQTGDYAGTSIFSAAKNTWTSGPHVPYVDGQNYNLGDAPAAVTPDGNIIFAASPGYFQAPTHFFAYTRDNQISQLPDAPNSSGLTSFYYNMLTLPTGQVLMTDNNGGVYIYTPTTAAQTTPAIPTITHVSTGLTRGTSYTLRGTNLSGITQGNYGDDQQAATNFPLVQITNKSTGHVLFARTYNFSSRSIVPGTSSTTLFSVNKRTETGPSSLVVISNGVHSAPTDVTIF